MARSALQGDGEARHALGSCTSAPSFMRPSHLGYFSTSIANARRERKKGDRHRRNGPYIARAPFAVASSLPRAVVVADPPSLGHSRAREAVVAQRATPLEQSWGAQDRGMAKVGCGRSAIPNRNWVARSR